MEMIEHAHTTRCWWNPDQAHWVCPPSAEAELPLVDVRDMVVVHTAMLREFRLAPAAVRRTAPGMRKQAAVVASHVTFLCDLLHHHHEGEDELLWPKLRLRVSPAAQRLIDDAEAQHLGLDAALLEVRALNAAWSPSRKAAGRCPQTTAGEAAREDFAAALEKLHILLAEHLDLEERALLPLAASALTAAEWHAIGEAAVAATPKPALALQFGMFMYEGDAEVLRSMLATAPPVPRMLLPRIAPRLYARRARAVHGTARP